MSARRQFRSVLRGCFIPGVVFALGIARAQDSVTQPDSTATSWQRYDWLAPTANAQSTSPDGKIQATESRDVHDPFKAVATGSLNKEKYGAVYTRQMADMLTLSCEANAIVVSDDAQELSNGQKVGVQFQPMPQLTLRCDVHGVGRRCARMPADSTTTTGAACFGGEASAAQQRDADGRREFGPHRRRCPHRPRLGRPTAYDVQYQQPLGKLPLSAVLKGHYEGTSTGGGAPDEPALAGAIAGLEAGGRHHDPGGPAPAAVPGISRRRSSAQRGALRRLVAEGDR